MARLCEIPSPSGDEGAVAHAVRAELAGLGCEVFEDDAADRLSAGCGNIVARFPATAERGVPIMFAAHLDTVPNVGPIEVRVDDGALRNRHPTILGGDDKSAVAVLLTAMRALQDGGRPHAGVELVFTPCEEVGLRGAAAFDPLSLDARFGFVYDHTGPVGDVITAAPALRALTATFHGQAAHAGIAPEEGRSAVAAASRAVARMPLGRIDAETTANVGTVRGGTATNVVAERCDLTAEVRSRAPATLATQLTTMLDALTWAASECEVDLETRVDNVFSGYRLADDDPQLALALRVLSAQGYVPRQIASGGGSDVNAFVANGFPAVNLCNGMVAVHTPDEHISVDALERMVKVTLGLVEGARDAA
jgi:tripeptide aminopeptidase